jgi:hypothetical protein
LRIDEPPPGSPIAFRERRRRAEIRRPGSHDALELLSDVMANTSRMREEATVSVRMHRHLLRPISRISSHHVSISQ